MKRAVERKHGVFYCLKQLLENKVFREPSVFEVLIWQDPAREHNKAFCSIGTTTMVAMRSTQAIS